MFIMVNIVNNRIRIFLFPVHLPPTNVGGVDKIIIVFELYFVARFFDAFFVAIDFLWC